MHLTSSPVDWYAARAAGIAAYLVLTVVVTVGLALSGRAPTKRWPRFAVEEVHRFGGLLVAFFVSIHVLTIAADSYLPFSLTQLVVPLASRYRPLWTGLGIAAAELLLALALTNRYRRRLPHRFWRRAHYLNFAVWILALAHGIFAGTDSTTIWALALYVPATALVVGLTVRRVLRTAPLLWPGTAGVVAAELVIVLALAR